MAFKNRFNSGELDKWCLGAIDDPAYQQGVAWLENFQQLENGGLNRRKGYKFIAEILEGTTDEAVKLTPISIAKPKHYIVYIPKKKYGFNKFSN